MESLQFRFRGTISANGHVKGTTLCCARSQTWSCLPSRWLGKLSQDRNARLAGVRSAVQVTYGMKSSVEEPYIPYAPEADWDTIWGRFEDLAEFQGFTGQWERVPLSADQEATDLRGYRLFKQSGMEQCICTTRSRGELVQRPACVWRTVNHSSFYWQQGARSLVLKQHMKGCEGDGDGVAHRNILNKQTSPMYQPHPRHEGAYFAQWDMPRAAVIRPDGLCHPFLAVHEGDTPYRLRYACVASHPACDIWVTFRYSCPLKELQPQGVPYFAGESFFVTPHRRWSSTPVFNTTTGQAMYAMAINEWPCGNADEAPDFSIGQLRGRLSDNPETWLEHGHWRGTQYILQHVEGTTLVRHPLRDISWTPPPPSTDQQHLVRFSDLTYASCTPSVPVQQRDVPLQGWAFEVGVQVDEGTFARSRVLYDGEGSLSSVEGEVYIKDR